MAPKRLDKERSPLVANGRANGHEAHTLLRDVLDISPVCKEGASALVNDTFLRCFMSKQENWGSGGIAGAVASYVLRYLILLPVRFVFLVVANVLILLGFTLVYMLLPKSSFRQAAARRLAQALCISYMVSWSAIVNFHGPKPVPTSNCIWVANHTSMIDYVILNSYCPFAVTMQLQTGWARFIQTYVMSSLGCLWFNRTDMKDRLVLQEKMKAHVTAPGAVPLLVFPEGTCVNNEYTVLFKRGAFDMGCTICPIALKYNKDFADAFWNSKRQSWLQHLYRLMSSWALVCDVWFLEPQDRREGESAEEFASRVQRMIADRAQLQVVSWDGYLKYFKLSDKNPGLIEQRRQLYYSNSIKRHLRETEETNGAADADAK